MCRQGGTLVWRWVGGEISSRMRNTVSGSSTGGHGKFQLYASEGLGEAARRISEALAEEASFQAVRAPEVKSSAQSWKERERNSCGHCHCLHLQWLYGNQENCNEAIVRKKRDLRPCFLIVFWLFPESAKIINNVIMTELPTLIQDGALVLLFASKVILSVLPILLVSKNVIFSILFCLCAPKPE